MKRYSVAMTSQVCATLTHHLLRDDGQEDLCLATFQASTGACRYTALLSDVVAPHPGERTVHGNVSFTGGYVERAAMLAAERGHGVALLHSHPRARGWQSMSSWDRDAEQAFANLVRELTGQPLVGLTLAGSDHTWSARVWALGVGRQVSEIECESVRVIGDSLTISWNTALRPAPQRQEAQVETVNSWGDAMQADLARIRTLVVGGGSVGLDVALRLAATGVQHIGVMDFDVVESKNLDRTPGTTPMEALLKVPKVTLAGRLAKIGATADRFEFEPIVASICDPHGHKIALDYDLIISCVDRPWPRSVLNMLAYADLIPVIDGGVAVDTFPDGAGLRNAVWRSHVVRPGRPCMVCNGQLDPGQVQLDKEGLLDDPEYISGLPRHARPQSQNVAAFSVNVTASLLAQWISFVVNPGGQTDPGPVRFSLSDFELERLARSSGEHCPYEASTALGDRRVELTGSHSPLPDRGRASLPSRIAGMLYGLNRHAEQRLVNWARGQLRGP